MFNYNAKDIKKIFRQPNENFN